MAFVRGGIAIIATILLGASTAGAQQFKYGEKGDQVKGVEWKASAQAGLIMTTGNSKTTTFSSGAKASRKQGFNKFQLEGGAALAKSALYVIDDQNGNGIIDNEAEIARETQTTTEAWLLKARYDRFLTDNNSLFVTGIASADEPAGKEFVGGGQVGYARQLYNSKNHTVSAEVGYDFSYEDLVVGDASSIHSLRGFVGYDGKLSPDTGVGASVEGLFNLNTLDSAQGEEIGFFEDARVNTKLAITTKMYENINFQFSFEAKFDNAPAPLPQFGPGFANGFVPLADELDTKTSASLIYNFL